MPNARATVGRSSRPSAAAALALFAVLLSANPAFAAKGCARRCGTDTTAPSVAIASPAAGSSVAGIVTVSGSASDNASVSRVDVAVDGGSYQAASGATSWTWTFDSTTRTDGSHTIAARATDSAGLTTTTSVTVAVSNTPPPPPADTTPPGVGITAPTAGATVSGTVAVSGPASDAVAVARVDVSVDGGAWSTASGTTAWSWSWASTTVPDGSHTLTARAIDTSGNTSSASVTVTVANATAPTPPPPGPAPNTQGSWVSPEGVHVNVASAGPWTISGIYSMLKANALELDVLGPSYTINVQDTTASQTVTSASSTDGVWGDFRATTYLKGVNSTFANQPDAQLAYEYGGAWTRYHLYISHARDWTPYLTTRWSSSDGSVKLGQDSRLNSTLAWSPSEMICDDYRLLFGSALAVSERPAYLNPDVVDPRNQPGLRDWFLTTWA